MLSPDLLRRAEDFFHEKIPLTRAMGVRVVSHETAGFALEAPVAMNSNHLQTAFGGSINAVATLAGYGFLWLALQDAAVEMVVAESSIRFLSPVRATICAICSAPDPARFAAFEKTLGDQGKARFALHVRVEEKGKLAAEFRGTFVAFRGHGEAAA